MQKPPHVYVWSHNTVSELEGEWDDPGVREMDLTEFASPNFTLMSAGLTSTPPLMS